MVQKIVTFDVALKSTERQWVQKVPEVYTNDLGSVSIQFKITDCTDTELTGSTAMVLLKMRDGSFFQGPSVDVTRTLNVFSYTLKENEGNHDGLAEIQLIVTIGAKEFATQKYNFKVITGLDSEVAREIMIYDWSTLTAEARAYIDQFTADEVLRDAEFDNNQFDRNAAFVADQGQRDTDFGLAQTQRNTDFGTDQAQRVTDFNAAEAARVLAFNNAETARAAGYDADHSRAETDHTGATTDRTNAENDRTNAATDRTNAAADRTLAGTDHTRAESDHTRANADSATVTGFNGRLTDVETDTSFDATNLVSNGDFSNGTTGWVASNSTPTVAANTLSVVGDGTATSPRVNQVVTGAYGRKVYMRARVRVTNANATSIYFRTGDGVIQSIQTAPVMNQWYNMHILGNFLTNSIRIDHNYPDLATANGKVMEVQYVSAIDLTTTFGKGNEPTVEQMDAIMAKFENSWFDGTKNLFQAKASLNKLMALDARTEFEARNLVVNGDMANGATGWNTGNGTISAANNTLSSLGNGGGATVSIHQVQPLVPAAKYYIKAKVRVTNANCSAMMVGSDINNNSLFVSNPVANTWYSASHIFTKSTDTFLRLRHVYIDAETANGKVMEVQYVAFIDLTATFGAGKEPTLAEMDRLMARYPNSWFDGVKPIQTIETLYQEKANKVQEAWITPTLLNGWVEQSGYPVRYMKDEMGFVHLKGLVSGVTLNTTAFILPVGYRHTSGHLHFPLMSNNVFGGLHIGSNGVTTINVGDIAKVSLNGLTFRAEA